MKKTNIIFSTLVIVIFSISSTLSPMMASTLTMNGETQTELGAYTVTELETVIVNNTEMRQFQITYENGAHPVIVLQNQRRRCTEYIVRSPIMEIQYSCTRNGFGAQFVSPQFERIPRSTNELFISKEALSYQEVISSSQLELEQALGLIACYFPELLVNIQNLYAQN